MIPCWLGTDISYQDALALQEDHVSRIQAGEASETLFLLEHSPVYTIGRTRNRSSLGDSSRLPHPVYEINRGGQATYHGPGQKVVYFVLNLNKRKKQLSEKFVIDNIEKKPNKPIGKKNSSSGIPKYEADRMARRIFFTAGIPTVLGMSVFVVSYIIVTKNIAEIPPSSTIAISALFFLLGLGGLSFGILSASWDKEPGSFCGIENISLNIERAKAAFKPASQNFDEKN